MVEDQLPVLQKQNATMLSWPLDPVQDFLYLQIDPSNLAKQLHMKIENICWFFLLHKDLGKIYPAYARYYTRWMAAIDFHVREFRKCIDKHLTDIA